VVLLHAGVAYRSMWSDLMAAIAGAGYRAIAIDLPGFGAATLCRRERTHTAVLESLGALDVDRSALIGVSFGGAFASARRGHRAATHQPADAGAGGTVGA